MFKKFFSFHCCHFFLALHFAVALKIKKNSGFNSSSSYRITRQPTTRGIRVPRVSNGRSGIFSISEGMAVQSKKDPSLFLYKVSSTLPKFVNKYLPGAGFYQVVSTDYKRYAILYSCSNFHLFHTDLVWIWARKKEIDVVLRKEIYDILNRYLIDPERLTLPKNKNCTDDY
ncbi:hypothetical protein ABEB36_012830 [Hypothenemus hampei]|uniref:Lipocalin/cytosolic fatty-acid binding domain-containing protein n=1 Tax=Hypothenemus hampei TaxID=57062 RepID=A0ABD1E5X6_HYPHA